MLGADRSITVLCSRYDGAIGTDQEISFVLDHVSVHYAYAASPSTGGVTAADIVKIRIPYRLGYLPEDRWTEHQKAAPGDPSFWTLRLGDKIFVDGQSKTIMRFHDNTGRRFQPHWYVEVQ